MRIYILLLCAVVSVLSICTPYVKNITGTPHRCDEYMTDDTVVFLTGNLSQAIIQAKLEIDLTGIDILNIIGGLACKRAFVLFACRSAFPTCNGSIPQRPCLNTCEDAITYCNAFIPLVGDSLVPDCQDQTRVSPTCHSNNGNYSHLMNELVCFPPRLFPDPKTKEVSYNEAPCYACPPPAFSPPTQKLVDTFSIALSGIGMLLSAFCFYLFIGSKKFRKFQTQFFAIITGDAFVVGLCVFVASISPDFFICENRARLAHSWHIPCTIQGTIIVFAANQLVFGWVLMAVNIAYIVQRGVKLISGEFPFYYKVFVYCTIWGAPGLLTFIGLVTGNIEAVPGFNFCFISRKTPWQWLLFFGFPIVPATLVGVGCFLYLIFYLYTQPDVAAHSKRDETRNLALGHIVMYFSVVIFIVAYRGYTETAFDRPERNLGKCALENPGNIDACFKDLVNVPATLIFLLGTGGSGIILFFEFMFARSFRTLIITSFVDPLQTLFGLEKSSKKKGIVASEVTTDVTTATDESPRVVDL